VVAHHLVKDSGQPVAGAAPMLNLSQAKLRENSGLAEILVGDRVSPIVQLLELPLELIMIMRVVKLDLIPEQLDQSAEVGANRTRLRIPSHQLAVPLELRVCEEIRIQDSEFKIQ
jgi:hypothetical protein